MQNIRINQIKDFCDNIVKINGWVYNSRRSGKIGFLTLRDGFGLLQCIVVKNEVSEEIFENFKKLTQESSISVIGKVVKNDRATGGYEILLESFDIHHLSKDYPITPKEHGTEFLMSNRHLWLRSKRQHAILKIRHQIIKSIRDYFDMNDFTLVDTPIFTPSAAEGTSTLFKTEYFGKDAFLAQTGQLYGEASAMSFGRHYNFGPCFRAEKSKTRRHLTEFWMVEPEIAYCEIEEDMQWAENLLIYIINQVLDNRLDELNILERDIDILRKVKGPFPRVSYTECIDQLQKDGFNIQWGDDFGSPEETHIANQYDCPVIVHRFPSDIKAFYMKRDPENEKVVLGMDILAPEGYGEIVGGGERTWSEEEILARIDDEGVPREPYQFYIDTRTYGGVPHGGFGLGVDRVCSWLSGADHIREVIPFPRDSRRVTP